MRKPDLSGRPPIVWVFIGLQLVDWVMSNILAVVRHRGSVGLSLFDLVFAGVLVAMVWWRSRVAWSVMLPLLVLFLPFGYTFYERLGTWGMVYFAIHVAAVVVWMSPWMIRWVWKNRDPNTVSVEPPTPSGVS